MEATFYNLKLAVNDLDESVAFYRKTFKGMGFNGGRYYDDPLDKKQTVVMGNKNLYLELVEEPKLVPTYDKTTLAGPRMEFRAKSKEEVDDFYNHLLGSGANILCKPQYLFQEILDGEDDHWYATYFTDLNGYKFGLVYTKN